MDRIPPPSIDDSALSEKSLSITRVQDNLRQFQNHVWNTLPCKWPFTVDMAGQRLSSRLESLNEDDLFGEGLGSGRKRESECSFEVQEMPQVFDKDTAGIPIFSLIDSDDSPKQSESSNLKSGEYSSEFNSYNVKSNDSFKERYRSSCSQSARERRQRFSQGVDQEVNNDKNEWSQDDVINSLIQGDLPDVVRSSSSSQSLSSNSFPDVTEKHEVTHSSELEKSLEQKKVIEGKSNVGKPPKQNQPLRSVSFNEVANQYVDNEVVEEREKSDMSEEQKSRQEHWRRSSGYETGDSNMSSQDSQFKSQASQSGSEKWVSEESGIAEDDSKAQYPTLKQQREYQGGNLVNMDLFEDLKSISNDQSNVYSAEYCNSADDSFSLRSDQTCRRMESSDVNSSGSHNSVNTVYSVSPKSVSSSKQVLSDSPMHKLKSCDIPAQSHSGLVTEPKSAGNMPTVVTEESFSIQSVQVEKVREEIEQQCQKDPVLKNLYVWGFQLSDSLSPETPITQDSSLNCAVQTQNFVRDFESLLKNRSPTEVLEILHSRASPGNRARRPQSADTKTVFQEFTNEDLLQSSRCTVTGCSEKCCQKKIQSNGFRLGRNWKVYGDFLMVLVKDILSLDYPDTHSSYGLLVQYCRLLLSHSLDCDDEIRCNVSYCSELSKWNIQNMRNDHEVAKQMVAKIQQYVNNPLMTCFLKGQSNFHRLDNTYNITELKEFVTHVPMYSLGKFGPTTVCMDQHLNKLCVVKSYPALDYKHQLSLYVGRLQGLDHPNIVRHLWLLEYSEDIQVCTLFMTGGSLHDQLRARGQLSWKRAKHYMLQILQAVLFLHQQGVVYLNWQSKNMLFETCNHGTIKVSNFGLSCPVNCEMDTGAVKQCLPAYLCPPELLEYKISYECDSWGAGCLLHEMLIGEPVLHGERHKSRETVYEHIRNGSLPAHHEIFAMCWTKNPTTRCDLATLNRHIQSLPDSSI